MANYLCRKCNLIFDATGLPFMIDGTSKVSLPRCPNAQKQIDVLRDAATYNSYDNFLKAQTQVDQLIIAHSVTLATESAESGVAFHSSSASSPSAAPSSKLPCGSAWGKPLKIKAETEQEKQARERAEFERQAKSKAAAADAEIASEAQKLVNMMENVIAKGDYGTSSNFGLDKQYGMKDSGNQVTRSLAVIMRAADLWKSKGAHYSFRAPAYKQVWDLRMANFEKLIDDKDASKGKHNFHVTEV